MTNNKQLIEQAINNKQCLTITYKGHERKMSPHLLGLKRNGQRNALFYQYSGGSESKLSADDTMNWRCIPVEKIEEISISDDPFQTPYNYSIEKQTCVDVVEAAIYWNFPF